MAIVSDPAKVRFAGFELDLSSGELLAGDAKVRLQAQPFLALRILLENAGSVVTREELKQRLWPDGSFVDFEHGLNKTVARLRDVLDDLNSSSRLIETLPRRGYRISAQVTWVASIAESGPKPPQSPPVRKPKLTFAIAGVVALLSSLLLGPWLTRRIAPRPPQTADNIQSIAVLPLENLSSDPEQEYFADSMTDELITDLSHTKSLRVVSRASTLALKKTHLSIPEIADKLHVDAVVQGTVFRDNNSIRISISLTAAKPEKQLWANSYEGGLNDAVRMQNQIAAEAVRQVRTQISPEGQANPSPDRHIHPEAHDEYLRARYLLDQDIAQEHKAIPHLERAVQLDPGYAAAYAALGEAWALEGVWGDKSNREMSAKALGYSQKAVELDPNSSEAYASLGHSLMQSHRWNGGEKALRRALELNPNNAYASAYLGLLLTQKGRTEEGLRITREVALANPVSVELQRGYANMLYRARRYNEAIAECHLILELEPNHLSVYTPLANSLVETGRYDEAAAAFRAGELMDPGLEAWLDMRAGHPAAARKALARAPKLVNVHTAVARYLLGRQEAGLKELDYLANVKWAVKTYHLKNDPTFDPMRHDPRFDAIVKRTGLDN